MTKTMKKIKLESVDKHLKEKLKDKKFKEAYNKERAILTGEDIVRVTRTYKLTLWDKLESIWYRYFWNFVSSIPLEIKSFIQRGIRGYADRDLWDFCDYLSDIISKGILDLKEMSHGCPGDMTIRQWKVILSKISKTFKLYEVGNVRPLTDKECQQFEEGWKLFKEYFEALWD